MTEAQGVELVVTRGRQAQDFYGPYFRRLARWYDLYRGLYAGNFQSFRNNVHIPFALSVIQSDVSRKVQSTFGGWPVVQFSGYAPEDSAIARKNEVLISAQMKDCNSFEKAYDLYLTANMYGTGIARYGWEKRQQKEQWRVPGIGQEHVNTGDVVRFDGPTWSVIDPLDFWPQPGKRRMSEMDWVIERYYLDLADIDEMAAQGLFDSSGVKRLREAPMSGQASAEETERHSVYRSGSAYEALRNQRFSKPVELWEHVGMVPPELAPDGIRMRLITVANRRVVLRNRPLPYWTGKINYLAFSPTPDPHYFHGMGKIEMVEKMQVTSDRLCNHKLDALDLNLSPTFVMHRQSGIDTENMFLKPGRVISVDGPPAEMIQALQPDLRGMQQALVEIGQLWQWMQQATGIIEDTVSGGQGNRQTAREFVGRQEAVLSRLMLEARLADETFIEPLADAFRELDRQFLTFPHQVNILGSAATTDPVTGLPLPQEPVVVQLEDLMPQYRARAIGATLAVGKAVRQQNLLAVLGQFSQNPILMQMTNWGAMGREILRTFDFPNPDELMNSQVTQINQQAVQQGDGEGGGAAPGPLTGPPDMGQMDPSMMGGFQ